MVLYSGYQVYYQDKIDKDVIGCEYPHHIKKSGKYRKYKGWHFTHIKTGFAWLFKKIPKEYFQFENKWLDRCTDLAEMYVVSEIAKEKVGHISETLCVYNKNNSIHYLMLLMDMKMKKSWRYMISIRNFIMKKRFHE